MGGGAAVHVCARCMGGNFDISREVSFEIRQSEDMNLSVREGGSAHAVPSASPALAEACLARGGSVSCPPFKRDATEVTSAHFPCLRAGWHLADLERRDQWAMTSSEAVKVVTLSPAGRSAVASCGLPPRRAWPMIHVAEAAPPMTSPVAGSSPRTGRRHATAAPELEASISRGHQGQRLCRQPAAVCCCSSIAPGRWGRGGR